jgi:hypothetical protein
LRLTTTRTGTFSIPAALGPFSVLPADIKEHIGPIPSSSVFIPEKKRCLCVSKPRGSHFHILPKQGDRLSKPSQSPLYFCFWKRFDA